MNRRTFLKTTVITLLAPSLYVKGKTSQLQWRRWCKEIPKQGQYFLRLSCTDLIWTGETFRKPTSNEDIGYITSWEFVPVKQPLKPPMVWVEASKEQCFDYIRTPKPNTFRIDGSSSAICQGQEKPADSGTSYCLTANNPNYFWIPVEEIINSKWIKERDQKPPLYTPILHRRRFVRYEDPGASLMVVIERVDKNDTKTILKHVDREWYNIWAKPYRYWQHESGLITFSPPFSHEKAVERYSKPSISFNIINHRTFMERLLAIHHNNWDKWGWNEWQLLPEIPKV